MRVALVTALMFTLLVGVGAIVFYYSQDYTYSLDLTKDISTSDIYITWLPGWSWNGTVSLPNESLATIGSISLILGKMKFKNDGLTSRVIVVPRLIACFDSTNTLANKRVDGSSDSFALWPVYTTYEPVFNKSKVGQVSPLGSYGDGIIDEINPSLPYGFGLGIYYGQQPLEVEAGDELVYYISLREAYVSAYGKTSNVFKNGKIEIYELPTKEYNPISPGVTYDSLIYNPTCDVLVREFDPVETIEII